MKKLDYKQVLRANVLALMMHAWEGENLSRLAREANIGPGTATRIKEARTSVGLDVLEKIADVFHLQPWHLLIPNLDPSNPPVVYLTQVEAALYDRLRAAVQAINKHP